MCEAVSRSERALFVGIIEIIEDPNQLDLRVFREALHDSLKAFRVEVNLVGQRPRVGQACDVPCEVHGAGYAFQFKCLPVLGKRVQKERLVNPGKNLEFVEARVA